MPKPKKIDYPSYYTGYVEQVPDVKLLKLLQSQSEKTKDLFGGLTSEQVDYAYAPGKWTLKEMLGHLCDTERIFVYRALCMARGDQQSLPGMDENEYMVHANFAGRTIESLILEYDSIRNATIQFLTYLTADDLNRTGTANNGHFTVNALMYIIAGHELHHMAIVKERYL
ncbi:MAG: DinB family protein [Rhodothermales bacterium]